MSPQPKAENPFARIAAKRKAAELQSFNVKTELAELVESVVSFSPDAIADQIAAIEETQTLFGLVDAAELENQGIDLTITCAKTGTVLHSFTIQDYLQLKQIHGQERAVEILQARQFGQISPIWIFTDNTALDALQINDPYGYAVYATSLLLSPLPYGRKWQDMPHEIQADWHRQKAAANRAAREIPISDLVELNELIRRMLAIAHPAKIKTHYSFRTIDDAISRPGHFIEEIKRNLADIIQKAHKRGLISDYASYSDAVELKRVYGGFSNFRAQRKPRQKTETEVIAELIDDIFEDANIPRYMTGHEPKFVPMGKKREKVYTPEETAKMFDSALADLDLQTKGEKPVSGKLSFLQMVALRKKG